MGVIRRSKAHLRDIDESLERLVSLENVDLTQTLAEVDPSVVIAAAVDRIRPFADSAAVPLDVVDGPRLTVVSEPTALSEALVELLRNAVEATRAAGRNTAVRVNVERVERSVEILVRDHGSGVDPSIRGQLFEESISLSGRTGFGLLSTQELLALVNARIELRSTDVEGSVFAVIVPSAGGVRKEVREEA